jgi:arginyl-tRNA synthetase
VRVLTEPVEKALVLKLTTETLKTGLGLLGITVPARM